MFICFAEYRIRPECREQYEQETERLMKETGEGMRLYEGTDQPCLFVEVWSASCAEEAERIKKERRSERSSWAVLSQWIDGGEAKLHIWTFKPAHVSSS
ncbi:hypothetical protein RB620_10290 [Paenibacillus sp. LHD-117]|uniref:hypothetical protein n=1 Tax=Paenibacillus sp. LHD-117 TaxID=3071412 RepID=UPI0027DF87C5|nr:hypothetical protein [Paenibacillus sp. LHD-117]MDQ6419820.1 hypothetical protein [Paenibacillus sp. LHD-117]